jgi:glycosyltransferase involved in cell wall biosynthesis
VPATVAVDYHGVTPPEFLRAWDPGLAVALARAREELVALAGQAAAAVAHSRFMEAELAGYGFRATATLPILLDPGRLVAEPNPELLATLAAGSRGHDWLVVSRLAPNKRVEDVIKAFTVYRRAWCPDARLFVVGRPDVAGYAAALRRFVDRLGIEEVHFAGRVSVADLAAHYRAASVLVSASEHEGFGVPLLEAMAFGLPVVAYAAAAVPETLGGGGLLFTGRGADEVAALVGGVLGDPAARRRLVDAGRARVAAFAPEGVAGRWRAFVAGIGEGDLPAGPAAGVPPAAGAGTDRAGPAAGIDPAADPAAREGRP